MNTIMNKARRAEEENANEEVPPQDPQNPQDHIEESAMSNVDIRATIHCLTKVMDMHVARNNRVNVNPNVSLPHLE